MNILTKISAIFFITLALPLCFATEGKSHAFLPSKITALTKAKNQKEIEKILGKPDLKEKDSIYYIFHDFKYALSIELKEEELTSFEYLIGKTEATLNSISKGQKLILKPSPETGHEAGRYLLGSSKEGTFSYKFINNSKKTLYSVIWKRKTNE